MYREAIPVAVVMMADAATTSVAWIVAPGMAAAYRDTQIQSISLLVRVGQWVSYQCVPIMVQIYEG